jgi:hypothetical protein
MRYALLIYLDPELARTTDERTAQDELAAYAAITGELQRTGILRGGEAFLPASTAKVVTVQDGRRVVRAADDAPAELSGFYLVDCDEEQALDIAGRLPVATHGAVEVRPIMDLPAPSSG